MSNYVPYHMHSMLSNGVTNVDSVTNFRAYVTAAKECGMSAFAFSEHGCIFEWLHKKEAIEAAGMKYIHAVEAYLTETTSEKVRDNYHCVLIAKNYDGVKEINRMISRSFNREDGHFYYVPRITLDELFATSDNVIITTACLGGVLHNGAPTAKERFLSFIKRNAHRCFLEIQHHNCQDQKEYNAILWELSKELGVRLIAGTDTHALNDDHMKARALLQQAKGVNFSDESEWDLTFKTYDQLVEAYRNQAALPMEVVLQAIGNTNAMSDMVEEFVLDYGAKYPKLYDNSEEVFKQKINEGVISRGIRKLPNYKEYVDRIHNEFDTYKHNGAIDFMLMEEDYKSEMRRRGIRFGYSRGSVSGSIIAYLLGITEVDSVKYNLNFERFMNRERISLADIDTDWYSDDRDTVKDYLYTKAGLYCCDIVTFNTIALKGAIDDAIRGFHAGNLLNLPKELQKEIADYDREHKDDFMQLGYPADLVKKIEQNSLHKWVPYNYIDLATKVKNLAEEDLNAARLKYKELFWYVDRINGCIVSVGNHPAACVVSPYPVDEWFGTFTTSTDIRPISVLNMKEIDSLNFVKLDILGLDNVGLIYKTCDLAGIPYLTPDNTPPDDIDVWDSIRDDTTMIFQWESGSATAYLKRLFSQDTVERIREKNPDFSYMDLLSIGNGAIRPAGESYRDLLASGEYRDNGNNALNAMLAPTLGYLVYQEQIIEFLNKFCGFTMGEADVVRRHFSKKTGTEKDIPIIKDGGVLNEKTGHYIKGFIQTMVDEYGESRESAEQIIVDFLQVIQDASDYLFSKNHADPYSWIGYICGYLRYYYPLEFITSALNIFEDKEEKSLAIIDYAKRRGIKISSIKFRHSVAQYNFDRDTNEIFKGISSIKYMNSAVAGEIYALRDKQYPNFMALLYDLKERTSLDSRQLKILIELDFFSEFGDANYLMACSKLYDSYAKRKQINKSDFDESMLPVIRRYAKKETPKMFVDVDIKSMLIEMSSHIKKPARTLGERIGAQIEHLGYVDIVGEKYSMMAAVLGVDTKYAPKLKLYSLKNGTSLDCKIDKRTFNKCKLKPGDIIRILKTSKKSKMRRTENGDFEPVPGAFEQWIQDYKRMDNI